MPKLTPKEHIEQTKERLQSSFRMRSLLGKVLEWIVSLVGLVLGVVALTWSSSIETIVLLGLIVVDVAVVFILGVMSQVGKGIYETKTQLATIEFEDYERDLEEEVARLTNNLESVKKEKEEEVHAKSESTALILEQMEILARYKQEALNSLSEIMIDWSDKTDRIYQHEADMRHEADGEDLCTQYEEYVKSALRTETERTRKAFFARHRQFLGHAVGALQQSIESYLRGKKLEYQVSVAVKLFMFPSTDEDMIAQSSERNIFTGFRDQRSWNSIRQRSFPAQVYSVAGNTDFSYSLRNRRAFVFNNERKSESYENESTSFPIHYNCGATACISCPLPNEPDAQWCYGFIACDLKNSVEGKEPIDEAIAHMMECVAHILGIYYDRLEDMWVTLITDTDFKAGYIDYPIDERNADYLGTITREEKAASFFYNYYRYVDGNRGWPGEVSTVA